VIFNVKLVLSSVTK